MDRRLKEWGLPATARRRTEPATATLSEQGWPAIRVCMGEASFSASLGRRSRCTVAAKGLTAERSEAVAARHALSKAEDREEKQRNSRRGEGRGVGQSCL